MGDLIINEAFGYLFEDMEDWTYEEWLQKYAMARVKLDMMPRDTLYDEAGNVLAYVTKYDYLENMGIFGETSTKANPTQNISDNPTTDYYIDPDSGAKTPLAESPMGDLSTESDGITFTIDPGMSNKIRNKT